MRTRFGTESPTRCCSTSLNRGKYLKCPLFLHPPVLFTSNHRHPCGERPTVVADIGLRLSEGIQDLKLDQQLAPAREAVARTFTAGSTGFLNAVARVRGRWMQRSASSSSSINDTAGTSATGSTVEVNKSDISDTASIRSRQDSVDVPHSDTGNVNTSTAMPAQTSSSGIRPLSLASTRSTASVPATPEVKTTLSSWGAGIGSFFSRGSRMSTPQKPPVPPLPTSINTPPRQASPSPAPSRATSMSLGTTGEPVDLGIDELKPKNLDQVHEIAAPPQTHPVHESAGSGYAM